MAVLALVRLPPELLAPARLFAPALDVMLFELPPMVPAPDVLFAPAFVVPLFEFPALVAAPPALFTPPDASALVADSPPQPPIAKMHASNDPDTRRF